MIALKRAITHLKGVIAHLDGENNENTWNWNYNIPKRKLKPFNDKSNILHQDGSKFRPIDAFMLLFTEKFVQTDM